MIFGRSDKGAAPVVLAADMKYVARTNIQIAGVLPKLSVYLDGLGSGLGNQVARAIVYDAKTDLLVCQSEEVVVVRGQAAGWVDFPFTNVVGGCVIPKPGFYDLGLHGGPVANTIRVYA